MIILASKRDFPGSLAVMNPPANAEDTGLILTGKISWRRKWQPTPVFLPRESQGRESLVGCRLWGHTELDTTKAT